MQANTLQKRYYFGYNYETLCLYICDLWDLGLPRKVDPENPVEAHATNCKIYYIVNYPMTCGDELVFNSVKLACMAPADLAEDRSECAA